MTSGSTEKVLHIAPERLERWLAGFEDRHGPVQVHAGAEAITVDAEDGARAVCTVPFPPLATPDDADDDADEAPYGGLADHASRDRQVGVLLVRRGGHAAGVFDGTALVTSKVGSRHVQGRTAAGGQSQQRFARRRAKQAREAFEAAADVAARILVPYAAGLDAVVTGGDRTAIDSVLADRRLAAIRDLVTPPLLNVPDPKLAVLKATPAQFRSVRIMLTEPG